MKICVKCRNICAEDASFCPMCGADLKNINAPSNAIVTPNNSYSNSSKSNTNNKIIFIFCLLWFIIFALWMILTWNTGTTLDQLRLKYHIAIQTDLSKCTDYNIDELRIKSGIIVDETSSEIDMYNFLDGDSVVLFDDNKIEEFTISTTKYNFAGCRINDSIEKIKNKLKNNYYIGCYDQYAYVFVNNENGSSVVVTLNDNRRATHIAYANKDFTQSEYGEYITKPSNTTLDMNSNSYLSDSNDSYDSEVDDSYNDADSYDDTDDYDDDYDDSYNSTYNSSEYILPDSNVRYLTESDLNGLSQYQLKLARNEIYARHGRKFTDAQLQAYFNQCSWYSGTIEPEDFDKNYKVSDIELKNAQFILKHEDNPY